MQRQGGLQDRVSRSGRGVDCALQAGAAPATNAGTNPKTNAGTNPNTNASGIL